jgi:hypothetical protein
MPGTLVKIAFRKNANVEPVGVAAAGNYRQTIPQAIQLRVLPFPAALLMIFKALSNQQNN